jgi:hypothetical protein
MKEEEANEKNSFSKGSQRCSLHRDYGNKSVRKNIEASRNFPSCLFEEKDRVPCDVSFKKRYKGMLGEISVSHGSDYEDDCLLGCCAVW